MLAPGMIRIPTFSDGLQDLKLTIMCFGLAGDDNFDRHIAVISGIQVRKDLMPQ